MWRIPNFIQPFGFLVRKTLKFLREANDENLMTIDAEENEIRFGNGVTLKRDNGDPIGSGGGLTGSLSTGQVAFGAGTDEIGGDAKLLFDPAGFGGLTLGEVPASGTLLSVGNSTDMYAVNYGIALLTGVFKNATNDGSGVVLESDMRFDFSDAGTINNSSNIFVQTQIQNSNGKVALARGIEIFTTVGPSGSGVVEKVRGLDVDDIVGASIENISVRTGLGLVDHGDSILARAGILDDLSVNQLATPAITSVTPQTPGGGKTIAYKIVALGASGHTAASASAQTTDGADDLSAMDSGNVLVWPVVVGATGGYDIYRIASDASGDSGTTGLIDHVAEGTLTYTDVGNAGDNAEPPDDNTTGTTKFGKFDELDGEEIAGYIEILDKDGMLRKLAVIA